MDDIGQTAKFSDPRVTAKGEERASVPLFGLGTLWFNTGTLCNIACAHCYIESSPKNDRLAYLTLGDVGGYLDEIARDQLPTSLIGFTGGEPFMNPEILAMLEEALGRGFEVLVLTNAMKPMMSKREALLDLNARFGARLRVRVSLDDPRGEIHNAERGAGSFEKTLEGLSWLAAHGFRIEVAGRGFSHEPEADLRARFQTLFDGICARIDASDPESLVIFPEMDMAADPPEISTACWGILNTDPRSVMCASARMVVRRKGTQSASVVACTLLPYEAEFDLGESLRAASKPVALNHKFCASFCVLGGASCGASRG